MRKQYKNNCVGSRFCGEVMRKDLEDPKLKGIIINTRIVGYDQLQAKKVKILLPAKSARLYSHATQQTIINSPFPVNSKIAQRLSNSPGTRIRKKSYFTVIKIPRFRFLDYGVNVACGILSLIPYHPDLVVISASMSLLYGIKSLFNREKISPEMAYFYSFLVSINVDLMEITQKAKLRKLFNKEYKTLMKQYFPNFKLTNDFDFVFDGLMSAGLVKCFNGYYQVNKHVRII